MENHERKHQARIHIDQKPYESPNPTTGEALYKLGTSSPATTFSAKSGATRKTLSSRMTPTRCVQRDVHYVKCKLFRST